MLNFKGNMLIEMEKLRFEINTLNRCLYFLLTHNYHEEILREHTKDKLENCMEAVLTAY